jgi:hypothetical protein
VVLVTASNDYFKDIQFRKLNEQAKDVFVNVQRKGETCLCSVYDIVVGDIVWIQVCVPLSWKIVELNFTYLMHVILFIVW